jgi:hypothetical protein
MKERLFLETISLQTSPDPDKECVFRKRQAGDEGAAFG